MAHPRLFRIGSPIVGILLVGTFAVSGISTSPSPLRGSLLIQAEAKGEAWYVLPESGNRLYLGTPHEALIRLRAVGIPVMSETIDRIPEAGSVLSKVANDHIGTTTKKYLGAILIRADRTPYDAWYVHPANGVRYPLSSPAHAYTLMRNFALGVADEDIARIPIETLEQDRYPIAAAALASERSTIIPGRTSFSVTADTIGRIQTFAEDPTTKERFADGYIFLSIDRTPVIVYPRYARWFILGPQGSADSFRIRGVLSGSGIFHAPTDSLDYYGLYSLPEKSSDTPVFLIERDGNVSTLALGILATATRYPQIDAKSLAMFSDVESPILSGSLLVDAAHVYLFQGGVLARLTGADRSTIQPWKTRDSLTVYGDTHGLYATDNVGGIYRIPVSDPLTVRISPFTDAGGTFYTDPTDGRIRRAEKWDETDIQHIANGIVANEGLVYIESPRARMPIPLEGVVASSFFSVPESDNTLYSDGSRLYYNMVTLSSLDIASFTFLSKRKDGILVKDRNGVYAVSSHDGGLSQVKDADPQSFHLLYADGAMLIAKDAHHVFAGDALRPVNAADAPSFHIVFTVEGIPFGRDRNAIYYVLPRDPATLHTLKGADPSSFVMRTIPLAEPALQMFAHKGTDRIVYATDNQWIWFYDGARDGLLVIRRADQSEKVSDVQILEFARMYANAVP